MVLPRRIELPTLTKDVLQPRCKFLGAATESQTDVSSATTKPDCRVFQVPATTESL
jgi:hypothetical protein